VFRLRYPSIRRSAAHCWIIFRFGFGAAGFGDGSMLGFKNAVAAAMP
jgi:hypothetical protein